jgi:hypothetical protein
MKKILVAFAALAGSLTAGVTIAEMAEAAPPSCSSSAVSDTMNPSVTGLTSSGTLVCFKAADPTDPIPGGRGAVRANGFPADSVRSGGHH